MTFQLNKYIIYIIYKYLTCVCCNIKNKKKKFSFIYSSCVIFNNKKKKPMMI